jgi:hypothetical protein
MFVVRNVGHLMTTPAMLDHDRATKFRRASSTAM